MGGRRGSRFRHDCFLFSVLVLANSGGIGLPIFFGQICRDFGERKPGEGERSEPYTSGGSKGRN